MKSTKIIVTLMAAGAAVALTQQASAQYTLQGNYLEVGVGSDGSIINPSGTAPYIGGQSYSQFPGIILEWRRHRFRRCLCEQRLHHAGHSFSDVFDRRGRILGQWQLLGR